MQYNSISFLSSLINSIPDPVFVKDSNHAWVLINDSFCEFNGHPREFLIGKSDYDFYSKEEADIFWEMDELVFKTEKDNINEEKLTDKNGITHILSTKKSLFIDENGVKYLVGIIRNITEDKIYEQRLKEQVKAKTKQINRQYQYLHYFINQIPNIIGIKDKSGAYTLANQALANLFDTEIAQILGKTDEELNPNKKQAAFCKKTDEQVFESGESLYIEREELSHAKNKISHWFQTNKIPLKDADKKVEEVVFVGTDISEMIHKEEIIENKIKELNAKNEELQAYIESNLQLENFAYVASHDLREPIRTIVSFSQLLKKRIQHKIDEDETEFLDFIISATLNMQLLINDLLTFARVNNQEYSKEKINTPELFDLILFNLKSQIDEKKAIISFENIPSEIVADSTKFIQLFQNLISNAIKFQNQNHIPKIHISCETSPKKWCFTVSDNGIGIEKEYLQQIFILFKKLNSREKFQGSGIGLAVCKKIVEQHRGYIDIQSTLNEGTQITICLFRE